MENTEFRAILRKTKNTSSSFFWDPHDLKNALCMFDANRDGTDQLKTLKNQNIQTYNPEENRKQNKFWRPNRTKVTQCAL